MQPQQYPVNVEELKRLWRTFVFTGAVEEEEKDRLDPVIWRSWQRCSLRLGATRHPHLTRLNPAAFETIRTRNRPLMELARPIMEDIHQFIEGSRCAVLLTDGVGCVLDMVGDADMVEHIHALGCGPGVYWSEGRMGTNAIGLALLEAMPIQVLGPEHYFPQYHHLVCSAAPIHEVSGRIVGVLALVGPVEHAHSHSLSTVMAAARAISNQLQTELYLKEANRRYSELRSVFEAISEGIISWNNRGIVTHINAQAGEILGVNPTSLLGRPLQTVIRLPDIAMDAIEQGRELRDVEGTLHVHGRPINCVFNLRPVREGMHGSIGYLITLRPIEQVRKLVHRLVGAQATLTLDSVLGESTPMRQVRRQARVAAQGRAPVLLRGEDGVGKNPLARAIHNESPRAKGPFIAINCLAIPHELMLSEFLGYEGGAFSGALAEGRPSKFELADRGTLFLDEIESLTLEMQAALLQVIDTGHVMRLGSTRPIPVDVRIIAATSANLEQLVQEGHFSAELYYRFGVFNIWIPPLREHPEDIPLLVERTLARLRKQLGQPVEVSDEVLSLFMRYPWPGNVRELENTLERAAFIAEDGVIRPEHLPPQVRQGHRWTLDNGQLQPVLSLEEAEREAIVRAARACQGRVTCMAQVLGISRTTLWRKLKLYKVDLGEYRE
ncbi:MAG: PTS-dependent dihydroxyacetone kinase operon transcriptional regulator DhaR [Chloroflexi bacterium]|nr:PTS-dependent dihydroxyacetone kinase operon transcriptional regulator DhaR [Chloroflexota bacterium]